MTSPLLTSNHDYPFYILGVIGALTGRYFGKEAKRQTYLLSWRN